MADNARLWYSCSKTVADKEASLLQMVQILAVQSYLGIRHDISNQAVSTHPVNSIPNRIRA